jgi:hypothetical protein
MQTGQCLDDLIRVGWHPLTESNHGDSLVPWQQKSIGCLTKLVGADHRHTRWFRDIVQQFDERSILAGVGSLVAAREEVRRVTTDGVPGAASYNV